MRGSKDGKMKVRKNTLVIIIITIILRLMLLVYTKNEAEKATTNKKGRTITLETERS